MNLIPDDIDFAAYMEATDGAHKVIPAATFTEEVMGYFHDPKVNVGHLLPWAKTHDVLRFRPGEVTLWAGMNGHGKSLVLGQACIGLILQGQRLCVASMEMRPVTTIARMVRQAAGTNKPESTFIREFMSIINEYLWLYDQQGQVKSEKMLAVMRYAAAKLDMCHFVIDSLMKCGLAEDDYTAQKNFVDALCSLGRDTRMHIHLVAHSRKKANESEAPGKMDVKGSGSITDQVDNVITVWRNKAKETAKQTGGKWSSSDPDALLICDKQRNGEWEGRVALWFEPASMQFLESSNGRPMDVLRWDGTGPSTR